MRKLVKFESFTKLVANMYFSKYGDTFDRPNDPIRVQNCIIRFPDDKILSFQIDIEDYMSETMNIKISPTNKTRNQDNRLTDLQNFYITIFGNMIQFDSLDEYKFVRKYLNKEDLFDSQFDSYIYSDNHNGPFDITLKISKNDSFINSRGLIGDYNYNVIQSLIRMVKEDKKWKSNIVEFLEYGLYKSYTILEDIDNDETKKQTIQPIDVKVDYLSGEVGISEILYLYHILRGISDKENLKKILEYDRKEIPIEILLKIIRPLI